jgi:hypothetical protein
MRDARSGCLQSVRLDQAEMRERWRKIGQSSNLFAMASAIDLTLLSDVDIGKMNVKDLRSLLIERKMKVSGSKSELVARVIEVRDDQIIAEGVESLDGSALAAAVAADGPAAKASGKMAKPDVPPAAAAARDSKAAGPLTPSRSQRKAKDSAAASLHARMLDDAIGACFFRSSLRSCERSGRHPALVSLISRGRLCILR